MGVEDFVVQLGNGGIRRGFGGQLLLVQVLEVGVGIDMSVLRQEVDRCPEHLKQVTEHALTAAGARKQ